MEMGGVSKKDMTNKSSESLYCNCDVSANIQNAG
jgi:hypothetical protein